MPYCPECRDEFVEGVRRCADCDVGLVDDLSAVPDPASEPVEPEGDVVSVGRHQDQNAAASAAAMLLSVSIPARIRQVEAEEGEPGPRWEVEVPGDFADNARRVLRLAPDEDEEERIRPEDLELLELSLHALREAGEDGVAGLVRLLVRGSGEVVKGAALRLARLGGAGGAALQQALVEAVAANSDEIPPAVVKAYQTDGIRTIPAGLPPLIEDDDPEVRIRAVRTMAGIGGSEAMVSAVALLRDAEEEVREEAADAIWELTEGRIDLEFDRDAAALEEDIRRLEERYRG